MEIDNMDKQNEQNEIPKLCINCQIRDGKKCKIYGIKCVRVAKTCIAHCGIEEDINTILTEQNEQ